MHELQSRIFERTFRVEDSRNTKTGGSGLDYTLPVNLHNKSMPQYQ